MARIVRRFLRDESGATAIEYGLIGLLVSVAIIAGARSLGVNMNARFVSVATAIGGATTP